MNKTIWMLWFQGMDSAPDFMKACIRSWKELNPGWEVVVLDSKTVKDYVDVDKHILRNKEFITPQAHANVVRINLLKQYGGVWADTSIVCMQPLDEWLPEALKSGFFAFSNPGVDRMMANWFMASEEGDYITKELCNAINNYWSNSYFSGVKYKLHRRIRRYLKRYTAKSLARTSIWFHPIIRHGLGLFPYYWNHYLFTKLYNSDQLFKRQWDETPSMSAKLPLEILLHHIGLAPSDGIVDRLNKRQVPMYKLSWRNMERDGVDSGTPLDMLLQRISGASV